LHSYIVVRLEVHLKRQPQAASCQNEPAQVTTGNGDIRRLRENDPGDVGEGSQLFFQLIIVVVVVVVCATSGTSSPLCNGIVAGLKDIPAARGSGS
jgi:hypothetical protein